MSISIVSGSIMVDEFGGVRVTEDGRLSVFDLIAVCAESTDRKYPHYTWNRLTVRFPDLTAKCGHFKFKGRAQKETPVVNKETALEILGLLPGATGRKYREIAAKLVLAYLQNPESLADLAVERMEQIGDIEGLERHKARVDGKVKRIQFTDSLRDRGVKGNQYATITNEMTKETLGMSATEIKLARNVKNAREAMDEFELAAIGASESLAKALMFKKKAQGFKECQTECLTASTSVKNALAG